MMSRLLHLSDLHFGTERPEVMAALQTLAHEQAAQGLDAIVLSGDITQRARRRQFEAADAFLQRLPAVPVLMLPGNHDIPLFNLPARLVNPHGGYLRGMARWSREGEPHGGLRGTVWSHPRWQVVTVDTTRWWRHKHGEVSAAQVMQAADQLQRGVTDALRLVVVHQPVAVPVQDELGNLLRGHAPAVAAWVRAGVDAVLSGHIHLPGALPLTPTSAQEGAAWSIAAGTAVSRRIRRTVGNSVNILMREPATDGAARVLRLERWDFGDPGRFVAAGAQRLVLRPRSPCEHADDGQPAR